MKMEMNARILKCMVDGFIGYKVVAMWDESISAEAMKLSEAQEKFEERLAEKGVKKDVVTYKMST